MKEADSFREIAEPFETRLRFATNDGKSKPWIHLLLLFCTLLTTTTFGFALDRSFSENLPFQADWIWTGYGLLFAGNLTVLRGLWFSIPLLLILLAHEFGHYFACKLWRVQASLPYFMPAPTLLGTLGAFIRIRSPILSRRSLFDIGVSGPLAGFVVLAPILIAGVAMSRTIPQFAVQGDFVFGTPLIIRLLEWVRFPGVPAADISLHPLARAAWAGLLATAINLLPIGQLDGGHILYAITGDFHRALSRFFAFLLFPLGYFYLPWVLWAVILFFFGTRHPLVYDAAPLGKERTVLAVAALLIFILSFSPIPVRW